MFELPEDDNVLLVRLVMCSVFAVLSIALATWTPDIFEVIILLALPVAYSMIFIALGLSDIIGRWVTARELDSAEKEICSGEKKEYEISVYNHPYGNESAVRLCRENFNDVAVWVMSLLPGDRYVIWPHETRITFLSNDNGDSYHVRAGDWITYKYECGKNVFDVCDDYNFRKKFNLPKRG